MGVGGGPSSGAPDYDGKRQTVKQQQSKKQKAESIIKIEKRGEIRYRRSEEESVYIR